MRNNAGMNTWGQTLYGDPCHGCGFEWSMPLPAANEIIDDAPRRFDAFATRQNGRLRHPDLQWTVSGYLCHVGDNIGIWAERIASVALGNDGPVALYNQDLLADARHYDDVDAPAALWTIGRAVGDWQAAIALAGTAPFTMIHEELGHLTLADVILIRAHDVVHHAWDIERTLSA